MGGEATWIMKQKIGMKDNELRKQVNAKSNHTSSAEGNK
jgi:hypothetical protein